MCLIQYSMPYLLMNDSYKYPISSYPHNSGVSKGASFILRSRELANMHQKFVKANLSINFALITGQCRQ